MTKPTPAQAACLELFKPGIARTAFQTGSLASLRALVKKGYLKNVTKPGPGAMFSPQTHFEFMLTNKGEQWQQTHKN